MEIQKKFYEEKTGGMFDTLAAAKKACKWPYVQRVQLRDGVLFVSGCRWMEGAL